MASFRKHGNGWQVRIRRQGHPELVKTFARKTDGRTWALEMERAIQCAQPCRTGRPADTPSAKRSSGI